MEFHLLGYLVIRQTLGEVKPMPYSKEGNFHHFIDHNAMWVVWYMIQSVTYTSMFDFVLVNIKEQVSAFQRATIFSKENVCDYVSFFLNVLW